MLNLYNYNTKKQTGSTLIEILVAASIVALVLTAVGAMMSMSIKLSDNNEKQQLALQKAQEAMEFFRKERAINSWLGFSTPLDDEAVYCISTLPESVASIAAKFGPCLDTDLLDINRYSFKREAIIDFDGSNSLSVRINLLWNDGNKTKDLSLKQIFENY